MKREILHHVVLLDAEEQYEPPTKQMRVEIIGPGNGNPAHIFFTVEKPAASISEPDERIESFCFELAEFEDVLTFVKRRSM